jgi:hypothetical protein
MIELKERIDARLPIMRTSSTPNSSVKSVRDPIFPESGTTWYLPCWYAADLGGRQRTVVHIGIHVQPENSMMSALIRTLPDRLGGGFGAG